MHPTMSSSLCFAFLTCLAVSIVQAHAMEDSSNENSESTTENAESTTEKPELTHLLWAGWWFRVFDTIDGCPEGDFVMDCNYCSYCDEKTHFSSCTNNECRYPPEIDDWEKGEPCPRTLNFTVKGLLCECAKDGRSASKCYYPDDD